MFPSAGEPAVALEGRLHLPNGATAASPVPGVVLCHPQPATDDFDDPLLTALAERLAELRIVALRFNFRGVGQSAGEQTDGRLEPLDLGGAIEYLLLQPYVLANKVCAIGHGFGAYVALAYASFDSRVRTVVAVSPPAARLTPGLGAFDRPKLFVTGEYDEVSPRHKLEPFLEGLPERAMLVVSGAQHLLKGHEPVAADAIARYVERWAMTPGI